ncbi:MAG: radical SAM protein, partial [Pseudomonadota bacterium]
LADGLSFADDTKQAVSLVRENFSGPIVLGGSGFTIFPEKLMQLLEADFGIVGDGERFVGLLEALEKGEEVLGLTGVVQKGGKAIMPEPWTGTCPRPATGVGPGVEYYVRNGGMLNLQTKRGCPYKCIYCTYSVIEGAKHRLFEPIEVAKTARQLEDVGAKFLFVTDAAFNSDVEHSLAVGDAMREVGVSIPWGALFVPRAVPKDYYQRLANAGLTHVEFGTESLAASMLTSYRKPFLVQDVHESHRAAHNAGLHVAHYFMFGGPGETRETVAETLDNVELLSKSALFFFCGIRIYPGTRLHKIAIEERQIKEVDELFEPVFYHSNSFSPDKIMTFVSKRSKRRVNWIVGSGGERIARAVTHMHAKGHVGPLWEKIIP